TAEHLDAPQVVHRKSPLPRKMWRSTEVRSLQKRRFNYDGKSQNPHLIFSNADYLFTIFILTQFHCAFISETKSQKARKENSLRAFCCALETRHVASLHLMCAGGFAAFGHDFFGDVARHRFV